MPPVYLVFFCYRVFFSRGVGRFHRCLWAFAGKNRKKNGCFVVAVVVVVVVVDFVCSAAQQLMAVSSSRADRLINNEGRTRKRMR